MATVPTAKPIGVAVGEFVAAMMDYAPGEEMVLRYVTQSYDRMADDHRWPPLSANKLSRELVRIGCRRGQRDERRRGGSRLTTITFPEGVPC